MSTGRVAHPNIKSKAFTTLEEQIRITFPDTDAQVAIVNRQCDDLPETIRGEAEWVNYTHTLASRYKIRGLEEEHLPVEYINYNWYWINWEDGTFWTGRRNLISNIKTLKLGTDAHPYSASKIRKHALGVDSSESEKAATEEEKDSPDEPITDASFLTITDQTAHKLDQLRISPIDRQPTPTNPYISTTETHGTQIATTLTTNILVFRQVGLTRYPAADTSTGITQTSQRSQTAGGTNAPAGSLQGTGSQGITGTGGQTGQDGSQPIGTKPPVVPPSGNQLMGGGPPQGPPGGGSGGSSGGGQGPGANLAAPNPPPAQQAGALPGANGAMKGHTPEIFDSQRKNAAKFMREFGLWKMLRPCTLMYDLYKITEASTLKEIKQRVFEVFKDDLEWQTGSGAFKTVDCKKMNQVKLRA